MTDLAAFNAIREALRECGTVEQLNEVAKEYRQEFNSLPDDQKAIVKNLKAYRAWEIEGG